MIIQHRTLILLLLAGVLGGCADVTSPAPEPSAALFECLFGGGAALAVGESVELFGAGAQTFCLSGLETGADYVLVPFLASRVATERVAVEISGTGIQPAVGPPTPSIAPQLHLGAAALTEPGFGEAFHRRLREREIAELTTRIPRAREQMARQAVQATRSPAAAAAVPQVGDILSLDVAVVRTPDGAAFEFGGCERFLPRPGRVEAVGNTAIVVADTDNPPGGFTRADYEHFAVSFDTLVHPVTVRHFDAPTDIDGNGRAIIFFTRAVNELTPPGSLGFVGGFFFAGDLFPRTECPASNQGEIFYQLVPDPQGVIGVRHSVEDVRRATVGVLGHEYQHLINAGRRIYVNNARALEEVWLNEAMSHVTEELHFYEVARLGPRRNIDIETLRSSQQILDAVNRYGISNLGRFSLYLQNPDSVSLLGIDDLPTRGAGWAFLRYALDHNATADEQLLRSLVNATSTGLQNLETTFGTDPLQMMQAWTVSVYADDAVPNITDRYRQPSWNFRSIMPVLLGRTRYPLRTVDIPDEAARALTIRAGGAAYVRFGIAPGGRAIVQIRSGGAAPPEQFRVSLMRTR
jgi:hypothetical protein